MNENVNNKKNDTKKRSLTPGSIDIEKIYDRDENNSNIPKKYEKVKSAVKREEEHQVDKDPNYNFVDEYLEEVIKTS
jgi:hypothetical protein